MISHLLSAVELASAFCDGTITDTTIDTARIGCSDTTSMLAQFVVICFCLQFVIIIIIIVLIVSIMPSFRLRVPPTPNSAAISSFSSVTTSSQPVAAGTNLEALISDISDTTGSGSLATMKQVHLILLTLPMPKAMGRASMKLQGQA